MTTVFPDAVDSYTVKVNAVDDLLARDVNDLQDAMMAVERHTIGLTPRNLLYHSLVYDLWQEGSPFSSIADDTYVADLWNVVHNGATIDISKNQASVGGGDDYLGETRILCEVNSDSAQVGFLQFLTAEDTAALQGKTLSFQVYVNALAAGDFRAAILGWSGTADSLTSDVVNTWQEGDPVLATNWEYLNTPADQDPTADQKIVVDGAELDDLSITNLAVFVWTSEERDTNDDFLLSRAKLEIAAAATTFEARSFVEEQALTQQFLVSIAATEDTIGYGYAVSSLEMRGIINTPVTMRSAPTISFNYLWYNMDGNGGSIESINTIAVKSNGVVANFHDNGGGFTADYFGTLNVGVFSEDTLLIDARL